MYIMFRLTVSRFQKVPSDNCVYDKFYVIAKEFNSNSDKLKADIITFRKNFYYEFNNGLEVKISVIKLRCRVDFFKVKAESKGFCGYDWMVTSIIKNLKILQPQEEEEGL